MSHHDDYSRIKRLIDARGSSVEEAARVENEISKEVVRADILRKDASSRQTAHGEYRWLTAFAATEVLSGVLDSYLPADQRGKYDPKFALPRTVNDLWQVRQAIDQLGLPYTFYVDAAIPYVGKPKGRAPRLSQLVGRDVVTHVAGQWVRSQ
ncbi:hypothetical protein [Pseudoxanthomonas mexicana]|uniref:hypothetical protein n=1 Tax=Pseudoxanthomonas mexicana TaxID=128785 RepID=UPI0028A24769|nr:hypothetical protein [Pseudoxanthomonas mexicana]